jgi:hypothetical protein
VTQASPGIVKSKKRYSLSATPRKVRIGVKRRFRFRARVADAAGKRPLARGIVIFARHRVRTDARGVAVVRVRLGHTGRHVARLLLPGASRRTVARAYIRVRAR